jgi:hypothetical protein
MLRHQLGQHLVLGLDLLGPILDSFLFGLVVGAGLDLERCRPILKELLLPPVEDRGLKSEFLAELGDRLLVQQMPPRDRDLLLGL